MRNIRLYICTAYDPSFEYIEKLSTTTLESVGIHDVVRSNSEDNQEDDKSLQVSLLQTLMAEFVHPYNTLKAPEKRRMHRRQYRFTHDDDTSFNQPEFDSQSTGDDASQINRVMMIQQLNRDDMMPFTRHFLRMRHQ